MTYNILKLIRLEQWAKNLLIFLVPISAAKLEQEIFYNLFSIFIGFSLIVSSGYIVNDILDLESDRAHYIKRNRVLASGKLSIYQGKIISVIIFLCGVLILFGTNPLVLLFSLIYLLLSVLYSKYLKYIKFFDISLISIFFVYRTYLGSLATDIYISNYLLLLILFSSLALVTGKKLSIHLDENLDYSKVKKSIDRNYNSEFLKRIIQFSLSLTLITYNLWIFLSLDSPKLVFIFANIFLGLFSIRFYNLSLSSKTEDFISILKIDKLLLFNFLLFIFFTLFGILF